MLATYWSLQITERSTAHKTHSIINQQSTNQTDKRLNKSNLKSLFIQSNRTNSIPRGIKTSSFQPMNNSIISICQCNITDHLLFIPLPTIRIQSFETGGKAQATKRQHYPQTWYVKGKCISVVGLGNQLAESHKDSVKLLTFQNCPSLPGLLRNTEYNTHPKADNHWDSSHKLAQPRVWSKKLLGILKKGHDP